MRVFSGAMLGLLFIFGGMILEGGNLASVIQLTAFIITVGGAFAGLIIAYPVKTVFYSLALALTGRRETRAAYIDAARVFKSFGNLSVFSGMVGFILGAIQVTHNLINPYQIGPGISIGLISLFYTVMIKLFISNPMHDSFIAKAYPSEEAIAMAKIREPYAAT